MKILYFWKKVFIKLKLPTHTILVFIFFVHWLQNRALSKKGEWNETVGRSFQIAFIINYASNVTVYLFFDSMQQFSIDISIVYDIMATV